MAYDDEKPDEPLVPSDEPANSSRSFSPEELSQAEANPDAPKDTDSQEEIAGDTEATSGAAAPASMGYFAQRSATRKAKTEAQQAEALRKAEEKRTKAIQKSEDRFKKRVHSGSSFKKKAAIAGAAASGSIILGIIGFFMLLPLKVENIVANADKRLGAAASNAVSNQVDNLYSNYVAKQVLPNFNKKSCNSTIDATCVSLSKDTGPVGRLFNTWTQSNLENKMATKYNIVIGKKNGQLFMNLDGHLFDGPEVTSQLQQVRDGKLSLFALRGTQQASRSDIRYAIDQSLKDATLYDRVYTRFKFGKLIEAKYGIKRCVIACNIRDKFTETKADKQAAAKAYLIRRVISPLSENYGLILQCLIGANTCDNNLSTNKNPTPTDPEKTSPFQQDLQSQLDKFASEYGADALDKLVQDSNNISKDGFQKYFLSKVLSKALGQEITTETINKVANPLSIIQDAAKVVGIVNDAGKVTALGYAASAAAAAATYATYRTVADEAHTGHMDATILGSFSNQLSNGGADVSATPYYNAEIGGGSGVNTASLFAPASADAPSYQCDNGKPVPTGKLVCPEENFTAGNGTANDISNAAHSLPGWGILSSASTVVGAVSGSDWNPLTWVNKLGSLAVQYTPGVNTLAGFLGSFASNLLQPLFQLLSGAIFHSPFSDNMSGGRTGDMILAGDDVAQNKACQTQLGCAKISDAQAASIQQLVLTQDKTNFEHKPFFARLFDTNSSYSLVAQVADALPSDAFTSPGRTVASLIGNPFSKLAASFGSLLSPKPAFATPPTTDPFGVIQYGWTADQLAQLDDTAMAAGGYDSYWNQNCTGDYLTSWVNSETQDQNTGEGVSAAPNACMLVNSAIQSAGGATESSLLPADSLNSDTGGAATP